MLFTQPLTFIDQSKSQIGLVNSDTIGDMPNDVLYRLLTMPVIPKAMANDVAEVLSSHQMTQNCPNLKTCNRLKKSMGRHSQSFALVICAPIVPQYATRLLATAMDRQTICQSRA